MADSTSQKTETSPTTPTTKNWWESDTTGGLGCATLLLIGAIFMLYQVDWSGLRGKNVWDWLQLIIVPLVLAGGGFMLQRFESDRLKQQEALEKERIEAQIEREREQAKNNLMDNIFQSYLDDISTLLIDKRLQTMLDIVSADRLREEAAQNADEAEENADEQTTGLTDGVEQETKVAEIPPTIEIDNSKLAEAKAIVTVARARTVTAFYSLDTLRRDLLANFLRETGLVIGENGTLLVGILLWGVDLSETDLRDLNLSRVGLRTAELERTDLAGANLSHADLGSTNLNYAVLLGANLCYASIRNAKLFDTWLDHANLSYANLARANASHVLLGSANLNHIFASNADLSHANLERANLSHAFLEGANLSYAKLQGANMREAVLNNAIFNVETVLPDAAEGKWDEQLQEFTYDKYWSSETDMTRYTNPDHSDFWEPDYLKPSYEGYKPEWVTEQETAENGE